MANKIQITGNVVYPFELRFTESGVARLSGRIADTPRRFNRDTQQWEDAGETLFVDVTMWGDDAEHTSNHVADQKGRVTVTGSLGVRKYTTKDGEEREALQIRADSLMLHAPKNQGGGGFSQQQPPAQEENPWGGGGGGANPPFAPMRS